MVVGEREGIRFVLAINGCLLCLDDLVHGACEVELYNRTCSLIMPLSEHTEISIDVVRVRHPEVGFATLPVRPGFQQVEVMVVGPSRGGAVRVRTRTVVPRR